MSEGKNTKQIDLIELLIKCRDWIRYLLLQWKLIFLISITGAAAGFVYGYFNKPVYTGILTFALEEGDEGGLSGALGLASQLGFDLGTNGGGAFVGTNLIELFKSRKMVEKTLLSQIGDNKGKEAMSFAEIFIRDMGWRQQWAEKDNLKNLQFLPNADRSKFVREQDSILGRIYNAMLTGGLTVAQKDREVGIITIEVKSGNEYFAKYFTEALARTVSEFYVTTKNAKARTNLEILQKQTDSVRAELNSSIMGVAVSDDNTFNLNPALNVQRVPSSRRQVDVQANGAMLMELVKQTELAKVTLRRETPLIQIIDTPVLPLKKDKFGKLKGMILFGFLSCFLTIIFLLVKHAVKNHSQQITK
jgi:hypothetical protein